MKKIEYGFHGCLEAQAFMSCLEHYNIKFTYETMESMETKGIDNSEAFEDVFWIDENIEIPELAERIFDNEFDDDELWSISDDSYFSEEASENSDISMQP